MHQPGKSVLDARAFNDAAWRLGPAHGETDEATVVKLWVSTLVTNT